MKIRKASNFAIAQQIARWQDIFKTLKEQHRVKIDFYAQWNNLSLKADTELYEQAIIKATLLL